MALFLLESKSAVFQYDAAHGFVVAAKDEETARKTASKQAGDEGKATWLDPKLSRCTLLAKSTLPKAVNKIILRSFNAG